jgi:hypothetical protein
VWAAGTATGRPTRSTPRPSTSRPPIGRMVPQSSLKSSWIFVPPVGGGKWRGVLATTPSVPWCRVSPF